MIQHRTMSLEELRTVLDWAADEGWNPGLDDAEAFHAADPEGFFIALDGGAPVAAISVVNHSDVFAFLGLYLCRPDYRGRGIGFRLWQTAIAHAGDRTIGLDGVPDQQENYARSGFVHAGGTTRYSGRVSGQVERMMRGAKRDEIPGLVSLEAAASGHQKPAYLTPWFKGGDTRATYVLGDKNLTRGFATIRRCRAGAKIGPLISDDPDIAERMIRHLAAEFCPDIMIDIPSSSASLDSLCQSLGLEPGFQTARMYRGTMLQPGSPVYAVATLELG